MADSDPNIVYDALHRAEALDGYRSACAASYTNAAARRTSRYTPFFVSRPDVDRLLELADQIPLLAGADLIILHPSAEHGFPHTRPPNLVCLPANVVMNSTDASLANTLRHEAIHLHQRANPILWSAAAARDGWRAIPEPQIPARFRERCRINPDTMSPQPFWAWETYHVPLPLFTSDSPSSLADVQVKWFDLRNGTLFSSPPPSFEGRYGTDPTQPEHPWELLAVEAANEDIQTDAALRRKLGIQ